MQTLAFVDPNVQKTFDVDGDENMKGDIASPLGMYLEDSVIKQLLGPISKRQKLDHHRPSNLPRYPLLLLRPKPSLSNRPYRPRSQPMISCTGVKGQIYLVRSSL
jgi:hypothetical protein